MKLQVAPDKKFSSLVRSSLPSALFILAVIGCHGLAAWAYVDRAIQVTPKVARGSVSIEVPATIPTKRDRVSILLKAHSLLPRKGATVRLQLDQSYPWLELVPEMLTVYSANAPVLGELIVRERPAETQVARIRAEAIESRIDLTAPTNKGLLISIAPQPSRPPPKDHNGKHKAIPVPMPVTPSGRMQLALSSSTETEIVLRVEGVSIPVQKTVTVRLTHDANGRLNPATPVSHTQSAGESRFPDFRYRIVSHPLAASRVIKFRAEVVSEGVSTGLNPIEVTLKPVPSGSANTALVLLVATTSASTEGDEVGRVISNQLGQLIEQRRQKLHGHEVWVMKPKVELEPWTPTKDFREGGYSPTAFSAAFDDVSTWLGRIDYLGPVIVIWNSPYSPQEAPLRPAPQDRKVRIVWVEALSNPQGQTMQKWLGKGDWIPTIPERLTDAVLEPLP